MTTQRIDQHSTEFGLWLRTIPEIDSARGFIATNIDFLWSNYNTGEWMLIEEKRYRAEPKRWQVGLFKLINTVCKIDKKYRGFHFVQFEKTSPTDGRIFIDRKEATRKELIDFLQFKRLK